MITASKIICLSLTIWMTSCDTAKLVPVTPSEPAKMPLTSLAQDNWPKESEINNWPEFPVALEQVMKEWKDATGISIPKPALKIGSCFNRAAIACASISDNTIWFTDLWVSTEHVSLKSVLLHEVGHLYGVPHIDGDPLMSPRGIEREIDEPTATAIAVAKITRGGKVRLEP